MSERHGRLWRGRQARRRDAGGRLRTRLRVLLEERRRRSRAIREGVETLEERTVQTQTAAPASQPSGTRSSPGDSWHVLRFPISSGQMHLKAAPVIC